MIILFVLNTLQKLPGKAGTPAARSQSQQNHRSVDINRSINELLLWLTLKSTSLPMTGCFLSSQALRSAGAILSRNRPSRLVSP